MIALDKRTGKEVYRVGNYLASYSAPIIAKLHGEDYCVSLMREGLLIFRAKDGTGEQFFPFRATTLESVNAASPVVHDNKIFISEAYEIGSAMLEFTGSELKLLWRDEGMRSSQSMRTHWTTPLLHENRLYASSGRNPTDTDIRCIELQGNQSPKNRLEPTQSRPWYRYDRRLALALARRKRQIASPEARFRHA